MAGMVVIPYETLYTNEPVSMFYMFFCFVLMWVSCYVFEKIFSEKIALKDSSASIDWRRLAKFINTIALFGVVLLFIDRFYARGVDLSHDVLEARSAVEEAGTSAFGMVSAFLSTFAMFSVVSVWVSESQGIRLRWRWKLLAISNLCLYVALSVFMGSRSLMLVAVVLHCIFFGWLRLTQTRKFSFGFIVKILAILAIALLGAAHVFQQRTMLMGLSMIESIQMSGYAYTIQPSEKILEFLEGSELLEGLGAALYSIVLYIYHGAYEFRLLYDGFHGDHQGGKFTFWLPIKIFNVIFGTSVGIGDDLTDYGYRYGIFTTFVGPFFIDYAWFAPVMICIVGAMFAYPVAAMNRGRLQWIFAALVFAVNMIFFPVFNLMQSASGAYTLVVAVAIAMATVFLRTR
jgi:hypothetical protein